MGKLLERFDEAIKKANFNVLEMSGFRSQPILALKAGAAIGYQMAMQDAIDRLDRGKDAADEP